MQEKNPPAVVDPSWVTDSIEEGVLLPCVNYFLRDFKDLAQKQLPALFQPIASKQYSSTSSGGGSGGSVTPVLDTTTAENAPFQKPAFASKRGPDGNILPANENERFVDQYFAASRLHHIGTARSEMQKLVSDRYLDELGASIKDAKFGHHPSGPGQEATIVHIDMVLPLSVK